MGRNGVYNGFTFARGPLTVRETQQTKGTHRGTSGSHVGCGKPITWSAMAPVTKGEFQDERDNWTMEELTGGAPVAVTISDVKMATRQGQVSFDDMYKKALQKAKDMSDNLRTNVIAGGA